MALDRWEAFWDITSAMELFFALAFGHIEVELLLYVRKTLVKRLKKNHLLFDTPLQD